MMMGRMDFLRNNTSNTMEGVYFTSSSWGFVRNRGNFARENFRYILAVLRIRFQCPPTRHGALPNTLVKTLLKSFNPGKPDEAKLKYVHGGRNFCAETAHSVSRLGTAVARPPPAHRSVT